jgi:hypothetical protein
MSLLEMLQQRLGGPAINTISRQLGADPGTTSNAVDAALPLLLSAVARNAGNPTQAQSLDQALSQDHDGSILDDIPGFLTQGGGGAGAGILKHVLGGRQQNVPDRPQSGHRTGRRQDRSTSDHAGAARDGCTRPGQTGESARQQRALHHADWEHERLKESAPGVMGALSRFLDHNNDGNVMDDVSGMLGKAFKR